MAKIKIGDTQLNFELPGVDGLKHSIENIQKIKVIIFSCNHCPYAQAWEDRIVNLQSEFSKDIQIIMISSNDAEQFPDDSFQEMAKRSQEKKFNFPYLYDESQEIATLYGAERTPEVFVFDSLGTLKYHGTIDDNYENESEVEKSFLKEAIKNIINGENPSPSFTEPVGCTIKWKN